MNTADLKLKISEFFESPSATSFEDMHKNVMSITGGWGVGKSTLVSDICSEYSYKYPKHKKVFIKLNPYLLITLCLIIIVTCMSVIYSESFKLFKKSSYFGDILTIFFIGIVIYVGYFRRIIKELSFIVEPKSRNILKVSISALDSENAILKQIYQNNKHVNKIPILLIYLMVIKRLGFNVDDSVENEILSSSFENSIIIMDDLERFSENGNKLAILWVINRLSQVPNVKILLIFNKEESVPPALKSLIAMQSKTVGCSIEYTPYQKEIVLKLFEQEPFPADWTEALIDSIGTASGFSYNLRELIPILHLIKEVYNEIPIKYRIKTVRDNIINEIKLTVLAVIKNKNTAYEFINWKSNFNNFKALIELSIFIHEEHYAIEDDDFSFNALVIQKFENYLIETKKPSYVEMANIDKNMLQFSIPFLIMEKSDNARDIDFSILTAILAQDANALISEIKHIWTDSNIFYNYLQSKIKMSKSIQADNEAARLIYNLISNNQISVDIFLEYIELFSVTDKIKLIQNALQFDEYSYIIESQVADLLDSKTSKNIDQNTVLMISCILQHSMPKSIQDAFANLNGIKCKNNISIEFMEGVIGLNYLLKDKQLLFYWIESLDSFQINNLGTIISIIINKSIKLNKQSDSEINYYLFKFMRIKPLILIELNQIFNKISINIDTNNNVYSFSQKSEYLKIIELFRISHKKVSKNL